MSNLGSKLVCFFLHILISMKEMTVEVKKMAFCLHLNIHTYTAHTLTK